MTWTLSKAKCTCGVEFEARTAIIDGAASYTSQLCSQCMAMAIHAERTLDAEEKLIREADAQLQRWITECNCPPGLLLKTFESFDAKQHQKVFDLFNTWDWMSGKSIVLLSDSYGVGKTHLCAALVNKVLRSVPPARIVQRYYVQTVQCPIYFTTEPQLLDRIWATFDRQDTDNSLGMIPTNNTAEQVYRKIINYPVVIVDDVGKVSPRDRAFLQGVYFRIIDSRDVAGKPIILTTNLKIQELEAHIGGACADRLRKMCGPNLIEIQGQSWRR